MPRKVSDRVVKSLNKMYTSEVGAVGIYMDQHIKASALYPKFSKKLEDSAKEEMKHAEALAERINYLGKEVIYEKHAIPSLPGADIKAILRQNIEMEDGAVEMYNEGIKICIEEGDNGTRLLLEKILSDEERHLDESETELERVEKFGDQYVVGHLI